MGWTRSSGHRSLALRDHAASRSGRVACPVPPPAHPDVRAAGGCQSTRVVSFGPVPGTNKHRRSDRVRRQPEERDQDDEDDQILLSAVGNIDRGGAERPCGCRPSTVRRAGAAPQPAGSASELLVALKPVGTPRSRSICYIEVEAMAFNRHRRRSAAGGADSREGRSRTVRLP
jgi:hypothetical protein